MSHFLELSSDQMDFSLSSEGPERHVSAQERFALLQENIGVMALAAESRWGHIAQSGNHAMHDKQTTDYRRATFLVDEQSATARLTLQRCRPAERDEANNPYPYNQFNVFIAPDDDASHASHARLLATFHRDPRNPRIDYYPIIENSTHHRERGHIHLNHATPPDIFDKYFQQIGLLVITAAELFSRQPRLALASRY